MLPAYGFVSTSSLICLHPQTFQAGFGASDSQLACLHDQNKMAFLKGRLLSSQSELFENFSNCSDWLNKIRPSKKATFVLIV